MIETTTSSLYIVDDQADYRFLLDRVFNRFLPQYQIRFFSGGEALYQYLLQQAAPLPGLVILDLNMPELNGYQTLRLLKQHQDLKRIPVVLMTSEGSVEERKACYEAGVNSFLTKPIEFERIKQLMETVCHYWLVENQPA